MFKSFRGRLNAAFIMLITLVTLGSGLATGFILKGFYLNNVEVNLAYEASLISHMIDISQASGQTPPYQSIAQMASRDSDARITIVNAQGKVLGDSQFDPQTMDNHSSRSEIYQAMHGQRGVAIRLSETARTETLYLAVPFHNASALGVVRVAKPMDQVNSLYSQLARALLLPFLLVAAAAFILSLFLVKRFAGPLKSITTAVQQITEGNLNQKINLKVDDEMGLLVNSFNDMAEKLSNNMEEIIQVRSRLEAVLDHTVNGVILVNNEGVLNYANPIAVHLLAIDTKMLGKKHVELISCFKLVDIIDTVRKERTPLKQEMLLRHPQRDIMLEVNAIPVMKKERIYQPDVLVILNDITELKRLQRVRQDFVANISHELKTPVATISGFAETLVNEGAAHPENVQEFSHIIFDEAQRLHKMITDLLDLSRLESGHHEPQRQNLKVLDIVTSAIDIVEKRLDEKMIDLEIADEIKQQMVSADKDMMTQALINLLENAVHHSPEGVRVVVRVEKLQDDFRISVIDQGEGIPEKEQVRIFERFYRVDKDRSRKTGGTGLGLAIVRHLVEGHGGRVGVNSKPGAGSTFFFTIPVERNA